MSVITIIAILVTLVIVAPITWFISSSVQKKINDAKIGNANDKAREIIDAALKTAETTKKESLLEIKEESIKTKNELDKETKERRAEIQRYEKRVLSKEETLDRKIEAVEKRDFIEKVDRVVMSELKKLEDVYIFLTADHSTPISVLNHSGDPVPVIITGPEVRVDDVCEYSEVAVAKGGLCRIRGADVMNIMMDLMNYAHKFGA